MDVSKILWDDLRVLLAVQETGSFLAAGRRLGMSTSTIARRIEALEAQVARSLVRRTADGAVFEGAALELAKLAVEMRERLSVVVRDLDATTNSYTGVIRVSLGSGFVSVVVEAVSRFRSAHPETTFELVVEDRAADLTRREADVGLRTSHRGGEGVIMRRLGPLRYGLFAGEAYVTKHGGLAEVAVLADHPFIGYEGDMERQPLMSWLETQGVTSFPVRASTSSAMISMVVAGEGLGVLPVVVAAEHPGLRAVRYHEAPPEKSAYLAMHRDAPEIPRIRGFADVLIELLTKRLSA